MILVRLQRQFAYRYKDKEHYKLHITLRRDLIQKLGWKEGMEVDESVSGNKLILKPARQAKQNEQ